jgi:apolipoprotein N-acyltransferase
MLPILIVFLSCVIPQTRRSLNEEGGVGWLIFMLVILALYLFLLLHCGLKLLRMKREYKDGE